MRLPATFDPDAALAPIAVLDAAYGEAAAAVACVVADGWSAERPTSVETRCVATPAEAYEPGAFYKRELPLLLDALASLGDPGAVIVDGYVWLGRDRRPGLGARLHRDLGERAPVIGVAKTRFRGDDWSEPVLRGGGASPLFVTAAGVATDEAAARVRAMHGAHRIPTLLRLADRHARQALRDG